MKLDQTSTISIFAAKVIAGAKVTHDGPPWNAGILPARIAFNISARAGGTPALRKPWNSVCWSTVDTNVDGGQTHRHVTRRKFAKRWTRARSDTPGEDDAGFYYQRRGQRADRD